MKHDFSFPVYTYISRRMHIQEINMNALCVFFRIEAITPIATKTDENKKELEELRKKLDSTKYVI